jgi:glutamate/tyrosine decarboxylase-like PLP-dependent enzyme
MVDERRVEETLDPENWDELKVLGHKMVDDMIDHLASVRQRPPAMPINEQMAAAFMKPLPMEPEGIDKAYGDFKEGVLKTHMGLNTHPCFWGWVVGTGTAQGALAEMLATGINFNMPGGPFAPVLIETQVLEWFKGIFCFPKGASGLLVGGGSEANLLGLAVARNTKAGFDVRKLGQCAADRRMVLYGSTETHICIDKGVQLLGLGEDSFRKIPVDDNYRIKLDVLEEQIKKDKALGLQPFCVIGNAGTMNTGSFDNLEALAEICRREGLWFHIDGAFGAWTTIGDGTKSLVKGIDKADSLAFDLHKWMYMPFDVACTLIRREEDHFKTFAEHPDYFGNATTMKLRTDYGLQVSRYFRSLKVWMGLKEHGLNKYGRLVQQNCDQAKYFEGLVKETPELELLAPVASNVVCFRFRVPELSDDTLNELNSKIPMMLMGMGAAMISYTKLRGKMALRVCVVNHRSRREDFDLLVGKVIEAGTMMLQKMGKN